MARNVASAANERVTGSPFTPGNWKTDNTLLKTEASISDCASQTKMGIFSHLNSVRDTGRKQTDHSTARRAIYADHKLMSAATASGVGWGGGAVAHAICGGLTLVLLAIPFIHSWWASSHCASCLRTAQARERK